jgi:hypothetical protein
LIDDKAFNRMILRMIEDTCFGSTALAKGRVTAKGPAAYHGVLRDLMMKLEPKLAPMLKAGLKGGKSLVDFSIDAGGGYMHDCAAQKLLRVGRALLPKKSRLIMRGPPA